MGARETEWVGARESVWERESKGGGARECVGARERVWERER